jgi:GNAT superfamily N-acetyltransferase
MSDLKVLPVSGTSEMMDFITFPWKVYAKDPYWVPPIISERVVFHNPDKNPFFQHAKVAYFRARRGEDTVGTIAAFTNYAYNEFQGVNVGFFGFFEVLDDPEAAQALLQTAQDWARQAGHASLIGPAQFSTNDEVGLLIDGFDDPPRILMTYNPPRYAQYLEQAGFGKGMDLWAWSLKIESYQGGKALPPKLVRVADKVLKRGKFTVHTLDMKRFDEEVDKVKVIYNKSWERNWGFVPMTEPEFDKMAEDMKSIIDPDLVVIVERDGQAVGFGLTLPDLNQPLLKAHPRPGEWEVFTMAKLLWNWKVVGRLRWLRVFALGVLPEYRGQGVDALMYIETARRALPKGYEMGEMSWILENNDMMNRAIKALGGKIYKTYRVYQKAL